MRPVPANILNCILDSLLMLSPAFASLLKKELKTGMVTILNEE